MTLEEIIGTSGGITVVILTILQLAPIKVNPWSAIFGWIGKQFSAVLLKRMDTLSTDLTAMNEEVKALKEEGLKREAKDCRYRIVRFADEIYLGQNHSNEHYKQILSDVTTYEIYCKTHNSFPNNICLAAINQIKKTYEQKLESHDFLDKVDEE